MSEQLGLLRLKSPLRCLDCKARFIAPSIIWKDLFYARCPVCKRMDLNGWTGKTYHPPAWTAFKVTLGARRLRCEYCRLNFACFRRRKEVFTFKRWKKIVPQAEEPYRAPKTKATEPVVAWQPFTGEEENIEVAAHAEEQDHAWYPPE